MGRKVRAAVTGMTLLAVLPQLGAGCSLFFVEPPPPPPKREPYVFCHQSQRIPTLDGFLAALFGLNAAYALSKEDLDYAGDTLSKTSDMVLSAAFATLFIISASVGSGWVHECQALSRAPIVLPVVSSPRPPPARPIPRPAGDVPFVAPVEPDRPDGGAPP